MSADSNTGEAFAEALSTRRVTISPWVNERCPPLREILSAHDVARLTRRSRWMISGLSLIGRFPRKLRFHGRRVGWCRAEVLEWMARDLSVMPAKSERLHTPRRCARRPPRQACLPLECRGPCVTTRPTRRTHSEDNRRG